MKKRLKALLIFSGGLDSILAAKVLEAQGIDVTAVNFTTYFFGSKKAVQAALDNNIKLRVENISDEHLKIVRNPRWGYGGAMNPCIDCHLLMIQQAAKIMKKEGYDFVATGEVLGQRPMSQNKQAMEIISKNSGMKNSLLRPLSAKLLEPTTLEKEGKIKRAELLDLKGRSRKRQLELVKKFGIKNPPQAAGGCKLTEKEYGIKLKELFEKTKKIKPSDLKLLDFGRHFWVTSGVKIIVGRNEEDNKNIEKSKEKGDLLLELVDFPGPLTLIRDKKMSEKVQNEAKKLVARYCRHTKDLDYKKLKYKITKV